MARFIKPADFENGEFLISNQADTEDLEALIDRVEVEALQDLLGKELYDLFIADIGSPTFPTTPDVPDSPRFLAIYNLFYVDETVRLRSEGFIDMLKMFIWFEWTNKTRLQNTPVGIIANEFENGTNTAPSVAQLEVTYNRGIMTFHDIVQFILIDSVTYPEYDGKGKIRQYISSL